MFSWVMVSAKLVSGPTPKKSFQFNSGVLLNNWVWKFKDAVSDYPYTPGWGGSTYYTIYKIKNVNVNVASNWMFKSLLEFKRINYSIGLRVADYPFRQSAQVEISRDHKFVSNGHADINLLNRVISPMIGFGLNFKVSPKIQYCPSINLTYNAIFYEIHNNVVIFDSFTNSVYTTKVNYNFEYNSFVLDKSEVNIQNQLSFIAGERLDMLFSMDIWIGNRYLNNSNSLISQRANYRYVTFNVGLKYKI